MPQERPYKVIISGGGTGGHIYPAIAIANALKEIDSSIEILFVGAKDRMEMQKVPAAGYKIEGLWISGIQRRLTVDNLQFPFKVISSLIRAGKIVRRFMPDIAVGVGGYASWPLLYAASVQRIPSLIQEQNSYAGVTNKLLAKNAGAVCVAYPDMENFFPKDKIIFTGNPVRKDILDLSGKKAEGLKHFGFTEDKPIILVMGGSLGARTINESIAGHIDMFREEGVQVIWQTGKSYFENAKAIAEKSGYGSIKVFEFINVIDLAYAISDVVISRAGALSISELCMAAKPVILVPSPNVAEDHQTKNAMALVNRDAALLIKDQSARQVLVPAALKLLKDAEKKKIYSENIRKLGKPDAAKTIAAEILKIIEKKRSRNK